ncbi:MAG: Outer membrane protein assembly factor BamD [Alphaproteobacteria bacterium MarineAlpha2_Bin1]|nr:MAG: Outer membrane protein assembly factor BamD [Alphaproteobacteria bacterium MarineAlpha2_Bin1]
MNSKIYVVFFILLLLVFSNCSSKKTQVTDEQNIPAGQIYEEAMDLLSNGKYGSAVLVFNKLERLHPYSVWSTRAQLMSIFSHYKAGKYNDAVLAGERYIQLHPASPEVPYAYYLIALSYYQRISDFKRDQASTELALNSLNQVISRFPSSDYAADARLKVDLVYANLAGSEMEIGRYYQGKEQFLAAINRFSGVVKNYQTTSYVPEALFRLVESYLSLGLQQEAEKTAAVLGYNFPDSNWYKESFRLIKGKPQNEVKKPSFFSRVYNKIF